MMYHFVYTTVNKINGRIYVGKHSTTNLNDGYIGSGSLLKLAIKKYGIENFEVQSREFFDTDELAYSAEAMIVTEDFIQANNNYNIVTGGLGQRTGYRHTQERIDKIRINSTGKTHSEETKTIIRAKATGRSHSNKTKDVLRVKNIGKTHSKETKQKMSNSRTGKILTETHKDNCSRSKKGNKNPNFGKIFSAEERQLLSDKMSGIPKSDNTRKKMSDARTGYKYKELTCPYCGKIGSGPNMTRYHFDKCKLK